jgi:diguanylate cyclase (GGDEF)-like protein
MPHLDIKTQKIKDGLELLLKNSDDKKQQRLLLSVMASVKNLEDACNKQYNQAYIDALTNIPNRRAVDEKLEEYIKEANSTGVNFTYMNIDIKDFKRFNDLYGENVGDQKLKEIGNLLQNEIRDFDFVGRHGGDEYTVLLKNIDVKKSLAKAKEIKQKALDMYDIDLHIGIANYKESTAFSGQIKAHSAYARELSKMKNEPVIYDFKLKEDQKEIPLISPIVNYFRRRKDAKVAAKKAYQIAMRNSSSTNINPNSTIELSPYKNINPQSDISYKVTSF